MIVTQVLLNKTNSTLAMCHYLQC